MTQDNTFSIGIVGCGGISHAHAGAVRDLPNVRIAVCCDIREEAAESWMAQYGCDTCYTDYERMIREENLDGVLLATWPNQHREQIERCLDAGVRRILCEKALTLTGREAVEIYEMVKDAGAYLMEGFMYRHHPAIRKIERLLASGELGAVDNVRACFSDYDPELRAADDTNRNWRQRKECGGGVPYDLACYCVNACRHFTKGVPVRVYCRGDFSPTYDTLNRAYALIEYDNGSVGIIESSKKAAITQELQVTCAHGRLYLPAAWTISGDTVLVGKQDGPWPDAVADRYCIREANPYQCQLENFAAVSRGDAWPGMPLAESVLNTFTIEALVTSAQEKRPVEVDCPSYITDALQEDTP